MLSHAQLQTLKPADAPQHTNIVIGYSFDDKFTFHIPALQKKELEKLFALSLADELEVLKGTGKAGEICEIPVSAAKKKTERIIFVGVGDASAASLRQAGAALGRRVRGKKESSAIFFKGPHLDGAIISSVLSSYLWNMKSGEKAEKPTFAWVTDASIEKASIIAESVCQARDLIHTPSNIKTPLWIAQQAQSRGKKYGLTVRVLAGKELAPFGGLRAVGNSSPKPGPRFIEISYKPRAAKSPHVVIVGKGITFDTGGISLKRPYDVMAPMKSDMAGASAALSTITAAAQLKLPVRITVLMMCAENALSAHSQRPSDVITQYGGTTVEVINTDAEGRLVLADGLAYADKNLNPDYLVDIATLTGAATLGLGRQYAAMYTRDRKLAEKLVDAGTASGDRVWHMPLVDEYTDALESDIADLNHIANKANYSAGSVTAALFLEHFAGKRRWVHLDIAGTARSESDAGENPKGGTGFGVRLLIEWLTRL